MEHHILDFITTAIIANSAYDIFKAGLKLSSDQIKKSLGKWLIDDALAERLATELKNLELNDELSELAIAKRIEKSSAITKIIGEINASTATVATSTITNVTQHHNGTGDNIAGNKIVQ